MFYTEHNAEEVEAQVLMNSTGGVVNAGAIIQFGSDYYYHSDLWGWGGAFQVRVIAGHNSVAASRSTDGPTNSALYFAITRTLARG